MAKKIWIDCDPGIDDTLALMYALKSEELEVLGISVVGGNTTPSKCVDNVLRLLTFLNKEVLFLVKGSANERTAEDTHGKNGLGNYTLPINTSQKVYDLDLEDALDEMFSFNDDVTLVCLGPLTNWRGREAYLDLFSEIYIMGGCYKYPGNCSPVTEFNFWADSLSAKSVFNYFKYGDYNKVHVVGLEITHKFVLTSGDVELLCDENPEVGTFIKGITKYYMDFHRMQENLEGCVINDPVVIGCLLNPEMVVEEPYYVQVVNSPDFDMLDGQMIVDRKHFYKELPNVLVSSDITFKSVDKIWTDFLTTIVK